VGAIQFDAVDRAILGENLFTPKLGILEVHYHDGEYQLFADVTEVVDLSSPPRLRFVAAAAAGSQVRVPHTIPLDAVRYYTLR